MELIQAALGCSACAVQHPARLQLHLEAAIAGSAWPQRACSVTLHLRVAQQQPQQQRPAGQILCNEAQVGVAVVAAASGQLLRDEVQVWVVILPAAALPVPALRDVALEDVELQHARLPAVVRRGAAARQPAARSVSQWACLTARRPAVGDLPPG